MPLYLPASGLALQSQVPTLEELETRAILPTSIAATAAVFIGPTNLAQRVGGLTLSFSAAVTASDTDYWTIYLQSVRSNGTAVSLVSQTTKVTGGVAIAANTAWSFDNAVWPSALRYLRKGDILRLVFTKNGSPAALADGGVALRYEPDVLALVRDSFTRNDSTTSLGVSDSGHVWVVPVTSGGTSVFGIKTNMAALEVNNGFRNFAVINVGLLDCSVSALVATAATSGIALRVAAVAGPQMSGYFHNGGQFYRSDSGTLTALITFTAAYVDGDVVTAVMSGSTFTFYKNGVPNGSCTDATYSSTSHGLRASSAAIDSGLWDDFVMTP